MPNFTSHVRIATRGSALALAQASAVLAQCRQALPDWQFELIVLKTSGDQRQNASLSDSKLPKGLFTKELEMALLDHQADMAVHSLKDLPTELPEGLILGAVGARADARDVLVIRQTRMLDRVIASDSDGDPRTSRGGDSKALSFLPVGATVATSSTRRAAQLLEHRPDVRIVSLRGNVGTRLRKVSEDKEIDATILAAAGLERLEIRSDDRGVLCGADVPAGLCGLFLSPNEMLPCAGQAALGIEIRSEDGLLQQICEGLDHEPTRLCVSAERSFLKAMGGGCHLAVAAYAVYEIERLRMKAVSYLGQRPVRAEGDESPNNAVLLGSRLAEVIKAPN